ncbi:MAG: hypothetical protein LC624_07180 [Halobacteriales archaeon]|nr:hypothetical protein [Halobacteriales archaeon]
MVAAPPGSAADADWVLHRAASRLGPWVAWSATAHTLVLGSAFASALVLMAGPFASPSGVSAALRPVLVAVAVGAYVPLLLLALLHQRRRVRDIAIDPAGLTLRVGKAEHRIAFTALARVRTRAEPVFGHREAGRFGGFIASLELIEASGRRWEFAARDIDDLLAVLAWLQVLAPPEAVPLPPSVLAAKHGADDATRSAERWLFAALGAAGLCMLLQAVRLAKMGPSLEPSALLAVSVLAMAIASALYLVSYRAQVDAGRMWLLARGLNTGPPAAA